MGGGVARRHQRQRHRRKKTLPSSDVGLSAPTGLVEISTNDVRAFWLGRVSEAANALAAAQPPRNRSESFAGNPIESSVALVPASELLLESDAHSARPPPVARASRLRMLSALVGVISAISLTVLVVIEPFSLRRAGQQLLDQRTIKLSSLSGLEQPPNGADLAAPRLITLPLVVASGPTSLGLAVEGRAEGAVVVIAGFPPGMELSAGDMIAPDKWQISVGELGNAWIAPSESFAGTIDLLAELHLPDGKIADRAALRFEWGALAPPPAQQETALEEASPAPALALASAEPDRQESLSEQPIPPPTADREEKPASEVSSARAPGRPGREQIGARSLSAPAPLLSQPEPKDITASPAVSQHPAQRQVNHGEIAVLLKRGKNLIASGDLVAARIVLRRAADANNAEAALALAATYDPFVLQELKVYGFTGDAAIARTWYEKAAELGSSVAPRRLEILTRGSDGR
jgi:hypothetical protein